MKKLKNLLYSENGMRIVNVLLVLALLIRNGALTIVACVLWAAYLAFCAKHAETKGTKVVYYVLIGVAACLILWNVAALAG